MTDERRYDDDEVAQIFQAAASARGSGGRAVAAPTGFSLAELQAIGAEAGIAPERIAEAAAALDLRRSPAPRRTYLGMPVAVGRTVELPRAPTDGEWEQLVAELRATFGAHGREGSRGGLRAWTNGNLHAYVEPTGDGHRLRLGTLKGDAAALGRLGIGALLAALVFFAILLLDGDSDNAVRMAMLSAMLGAAALVGNALRLPRWADEREEQMEHVAARALALVGRTPEPGAG